MEDTDKVEDKADEKEARTDFSWDDIIEDATIVKRCEVTWKGEKLQLSYRELMGYEDLEVDKKYGNNVSRIGAEKVLLMLQKANSDVPEQTQMNRERWELMPSRLRNLIIMTVLFDGAADMRGGVDFLKALQAQKE